jgi:hypothetical protein
MTDDDETAARAARARQEARERARRRAQVFGDVLPETTRDDRDEAGPSRSPDEWLRRQVPPHHGD